LSCCTSCFCCCPPWHVRAQLLNHRPSCGTSDGRSTSDCRGTSRVRGEAFGHQCTSRLLTRHRRPQRDMVTRSHARAAARRVEKEAAVLLYKQAAAAQTSSRKCLLHAVRGEEAVTKYPAMARIAIQGAVMRAAGGQMSQPQCAPSNVGALNDRPAATTTWISACRCIYNA